jgi:hypothetical protein
MDNQDAAAMFINEWETLPTTLCVYLSTIPKQVNAQGWQGMIWIYCCFSTLP